MGTELTRCTAFAGTRRIASGRLEDVALATKTVVDGDEQAPVLVFDDATGRVVDLDLRGSPEDVRAWARTRTGSAGETRGSAGAAGGPDAPPRRPGRPKLGVVAKEITLLPRHWAWLGAQRGGASATLRRLVDQARKASEQQDRVRRAQDVAFRFMSAMAGDLPGFEEAIRALFAGDAERFDAQTDGWPEDLRVHSRTLAADAFRDPSPTA